MLLRKLNAQNFFFTKEDCGDIIAELPGSRKTETPPFSCD